MPSRPQRACAVPGCAGLTHGRYCEKHQDLEQAARRAKDQRFDEGRGSAAARGYGFRWRKLRLMVLRETPLCQWEGCSEAASEVDHIQPKRLGGTDARDNLQSLCKAHHSMKTARGE